MALDLKHEEPTNLKKKLMFCAVWLKQSFLALQSQPPCSKSRDHEDQGGCLFTFSSSLVGLEAMKGARQEEAYLHKLPSGAELEGIPMPLDEMVIGGRKQ